MVLLQGKETSILSLSNIEPKIKINEKVENSIIRGHSDRGADDGLQLPDLALFQSSSTWICTDIVKT